MRRKGFTLLEVMMALAVFGIAITALVGFNARGYVNEARARRMTTAVQLASQKMTDTKLEIEKEMVTGSLPEEKTDEGDFEKPFDAFRWKIEIKKVEMPMPPIGDVVGEIGKQIMEAITKQISDSVREIKLTIIWQEMEKERSFSVVTHIAKI